jgi:hypothetical protein
MICLWLFSTGKLMFFSLSILHFLEKDNIAEIRVTVWGRRGYVPYS